MIHDDINQMIATANSVKDRLRRKAEVADDKTLIPANVVGAMVGTLNKYLGGGDKRKIVLAWLFASDMEVLSPKSSKSLTDAQKSVLIDWIEWWRDEEETWHVGSRFPHEAICVLNAALRAYNSAENTRLKNAVSDDPFSLVTNAVDLGGIVTGITDLSKIDRKE